MKLGNKIYYFNLLTAWAWWWHTDKHEVPVN